MIGVFAHIVKIVVLSSGTNAIQVKSLGEIAGLNIELFFGKKEAKPFLAVGSGLQLGHLAVGIHGAQENGLELRKKERKGRKGRRGELD